MSYINKSEQCLTYTYYLKSVHKKWQCPSGSIKRPKAFLGAKRFICVYLASVQTPWNSIQLNLIYSSFQCFYWNQLRCCCVVLLLHTLC